MTLLRSLSCTVIFVLFQFAETGDAYIPYVVHYEEMGCRLIKSDSSSCESSSSSSSSSSPSSSYDCRKVFEGLANGYCVAYGEWVEVGKGVSDPTKVPRCAGCGCGKIDENKNSVQFFCYVYDCAKPPELQDDCHYNQSLTQCCSYTQICPSTTPDLAECSSGRDIYLEGQYFAPDDAKCMECVCQKGFKGKYVQPYCQRIRCGIPFFSTDKFANYCAPVYGLGLDQCCPSWRCASPGENETLGKKFNGKRLRVDQCRFGDRVVKKGTKFSLAPESIFDVPVDCECVTPPLVTCH